MAVFDFLRSFGKKQNKKEKIEGLVKAEKKEKTEKMKNRPYLRSAGNGAAVQYELKSHATIAVEWVSEETDGNGKSVVVRVPQETTREYSKVQQFTMAGKTYQNLRSFLRYQGSEWAEDIYGRKVLCTKEKYPCFDSYDRMYENRYFRWYFIREGDSVSQLFVADDRDKIYVTEDLRNVEPWAWGRMKATGFCQPPGEGK